MDNTFRTIANVAHSGNMVYFVAQNCSRFVYRMNLETKKIVKICDLKWNINGVVHCIMCKDKLFCVASFGINIAEIDLDTCTFNIYNDRFVTGENVGGIYKEGILFIFPRTVPGEIIAFDISSKTFSKRRLYTNGISGTILIFENHENQVLFNLKNSSALFKTSFPFEHVDVIIGERKEKIYSFFFDKDEKLYASSADNNSIYEVGNDSLIEYIKTTGGKRYTRVFHIYDFEICTSGDTIWKKTGKSIDKLGSVNTYNSEGGLFFSKIEYGKKVIFFPWQSELGMEINANGEMLFFDMRIPIMDRMELDNFLYDESREYDMQGFIEDIVHG